MTRPGETERPEPDGPQDRPHTTSPAPPSQNVWEAPMPVIGEHGALVPDHSPEPEPAPHRPASPPAMPERPRTIVALVGDTRREGTWRVPPTLRLWSGLGDVKLDLRDADFESTTTSITATSLLGDVVLIVPPGVDVRFRGWAGLGNQKLRDLTETATTVPVTHTIELDTRALLGDVTVKVVEPGRPIRRWWQRKQR